MLPLPASHVNAQVWVMTCCLCLLLMWMRRFVLWHAASAGFSCECAGLSYDILPLPASHVNAQVWAMTCSDEGTVICLNEGTMFWQWHEVEWNDMFKWKVQWYVDMFKWYVQMKVQCFGSGKSGVIHACMPFHTYPPLAHPHLSVQSEPRHTDVSARFVGNGTKQGGSRRAHTHTCKECTPYWTHHLTWFISLKHTCTRN